MTDSKSAILRVSLDCDPKSLKRTQNDLVNTGAGEVVTTLPPEYDLPILLTALISLRKRHVRDRITSDRAFRVRKALEASALFYRLHLLKGDQDPVGD